MRVLLINPPWITRNDNIWHNIASVMPPLGLAWIARSLERQSHQVLILDAHALRMDFAAIETYINTNGLFDFIGITATTSLINNALEIARIIKTRQPQTQLIIGGVHATVLPDEVLNEPAVDLVVRGEGEITMLELANGKTLENILGISYRKDGEIIHNAERPLIENLDEIGMPAYHLLPMSKYYPAVGAYKRLPAISMLGTRGCPGRCTFCYRIFGSRLRCRSGAKMADEVKHLQDLYGIKEISFYDDTFTAVKKEVRAFCQRIKELNVDLTWSCFSRVDSIDEDLLIEMKSCGLHQIMYGVESASSEILKNINKRADTARAVEVIAMTKKVGIDVRAAFMLGSPGETEETIRETIKFAKQQNPELAVFNITTPFPGTDMYKWAKENNHLLTNNWDHYDLAHSVMELPTISALNVQKYYKKAYRSFYFRPSYIMMRVRKLKEWSEVRNAWNGVRAVLKF